MPFPQQMPRLFNRANVEAIKLKQYGCYGLFREKTWIYIGKGDIRARLPDHLNGNNPCINKHQPTYWVDVVTTDYDNVEKQLIVEYQPVFNQKVG
jgi:hypothetical protein